MWEYQGENINILPDGIIGFVYLITNLTNNRKYIGKKLGKFSKTKIQTVTLKNGTKKKKKIKVQIESDWLEYYGSSLELLADIEKIGKDQFKREILYVCKTKAQCSYLELREQIDRRVLETDDYYNGNVMARIHKNHVRGKV